MGSGGAERAAGCGECGFGLEVPPEEPAGVAFHGEAGRVPTAPEGTEDGRRQARIQAKDEREASDPSGGIRRGAAGELVSCKGELIDRICA